MVQVTRNQNADIPFAKMGSRKTEFVRVRLQRSNQKKRNQGSNIARSMRDFDHSLPMELLRAREAAMARFRPMLLDHGLTEQQWRVIRVVAGHRNLDAGRIAQQSFLLAPSLSRILQFLENNNLISRRVDNNDNRRAVFALSAKGRRLFEKIAPNSEALYAKIEQDFGPRNLKRLYELLSEFIDSLGPR